MANRTPYFKKSKAAKDKENYEATTSSDLTSQDVFYTTESNETTRGYGYTNIKSNKYDDPYTTDTCDRFFEKYDSKQRSEQSYSFDDYTTSAISYMETKRRPRFLTSPQSKSEQIYSQDRESPTRRKHKGHYSPTRDYDYFNPEELKGRKRSKLTKNPEKYAQYELQSESEKYMETDTKGRSRRRKDYESYIHEELEGEYDYDKYFKQARSRDRSPQKHKRHQSYDDGGKEKKKKQSDSPKKGKDYQVYAYQEPKQHEGVFGPKKHRSGGSPLPSEMEIRTHEYPVLAFQDSSPRDRGSDMVYLPVLVLDKKSGSQNKSRPSEVITPAKLENIQVFAANLQDQRNIFQTNGDVSNQQIQRVSNPENMFSQETRNVSESKPEISSGLRYAGSLLGSIFDQAEFSRKPPKENFSKETKASLQGTLKLNKDPFIYQVNIDIPGTSNVFAGKKSKEEPIDTNDQIGYKEINDPLRDDYPVTKDYIKVSDTSGHRESTKLPDKGSEEKRRSSKNKSIESPAFVVDKTTMPAKISKNLSRKSNEDSFAERRIGSAKMSTAKESMGLKNSMMMESKHGSMAIASHLQQDGDIEVKGTPGTTRLSAVHENVVQEQVDTQRKSTATAMTKEPSAERRSKTESKAWAAPQEIEVARASVETSRASVDPQMPSQPKLSGMDSKAKQSKPSVVSTVPLEKHSTITSHGRISQQQNLAQQVPVAKEATIVEDREENSQEDLRQFTKNVFQLDDGLLEPPESRTSLRKKENGGGKTPSVITMKGTVAPLEHSSQRTESEMRKGTTLRQSSKKQSMPEIAKEKSRGSGKSVVGLPPSGLEESSKKVSIKSGERKSNVQESRPLEETEVEDTGVGKDTTKQDEEKVTTVVDFVTEPPESKPVTLPPTKSKRSFKNPLSHLGRKKSAISTKPYIQVKPGSQTGTLKSEGKTKSIGNGQDDNHSLFMQSIEPTSTLYKKEQQVEKTPTVKSIKNEEGREAKRKQSQVQAAQSKSETKVPTVTDKKSKSRMSKLFSRSRSRTNIDHESGDEKGQSKPKLHKTRSGRNVWGILKRSKSKTDNGSTTSLATQHGRPPHEGPDEREQNLMKEERKKPEKGEEKQCDCIVEYVKFTRECGYFFLGTTLHQQVMNILKVF